MRSRFVSHQLPNGLRIVCEVMPGVRSAAVGFLVRTGARDELPDQHGVSHFLEHMCFKGTARRTSRDINVRFDELGSIYNAYTGKEQTVYYGWVPGARIEAQIELLSDMMRPALAPAELETERRVILEEIAMSDDNLDRLVWNFAHEVIFGSHPLAHEILGEREAVANLSRDALGEYHRRRYSPQNMYLLAAGAIDPDCVIAAGGRCCGGWPTEPGCPQPGPPNDRREDTPARMPPPFPKGVRKRQLERFKQQSVLLIFRSVPRPDADDEAIEALSMLFGGHNSRCYWNIVQKGICVSAGGAWVAYRDCGVFVLYAQGEPERCEQMIDALREQARDVTVGGFRPDEVQRVKNQRRTQLSLESESPRTRIMQLADDLETRGYVRTADARLAAVEAVAAEAIADYLERCPITGEGLLVSCGPRDWP